MEYCAGGELEERLTEKAREQHGEIPEATLWRWLVLPVPTPVKRHKNDPEKTTTRNDTKKRH